MKDTYFIIVMLMERLHRLFLDVIRLELEKRKLRDINHVQSLILYNIGADKLTVGEISNRGYYLGTNVTYNLKKLIENGYVFQEASPHDKRSLHIFLTPKGLTLLNELKIIFEDHIRNLKINQVQEEDLKGAVQALRKLESFWSFIVLHQPKN